MGEIHFSGFFFLKVTNTSFSQMGEIISSGWEKF